MSEPRLTSKDTNPKDAVGTAKAPFSTVSAPVMLEVGLAMMEGARKYGRHNFRVAGVRASVYYDATLRHLMSWWEGEDLDPDSGLSHITKAIAGLMVLRDSMLQENWVDDRPPVSKPGWLAELNKRAAELLVKYPTSVPAYLAKDHATVREQEPARTLDDVLTGGVPLEPASLEQAVAAAVVAGTQVNPSAPMDQHEVDAAMRQGFYNFPGAAAEYHWVENRGEMTERVGVAGHVHEVPHGAIVREVRFR